MTHRIIMSPDDSVIAPIERDVYFLIYETIDFPIGQLICRLVCSGLLITNFRIWLTSDLKNTFTKKRAKNNCKKLEMSEIRHRPSKTKAAKTKTRTATKSDTTKTVNKIRTSEKYDMVSDKNAVSISFGTSLRTSLSCPLWSTSPFGPHLLSSRSTF